MRWVSGSKSGSGLFTSIRPVHDATLRGTPVATGKATDESYRPGMPAARHNGISSRTFRTRRNLWTVWIKAAAASAALCAFAVPVTSNAQSGAPSTFPSASMSCEDIVISRDPLHRPAAEVEADILRGAAFLANIEECSYERGDFKEAASTYSRIGNRWVVEPSILISYTDSPRISNWAVVLDHIALSFEKIGDGANARRAIRDANLANQTEHSPAVDADYHRIDRRHIQETDAALGVALNKSLAEAEQKRLARLGTPTERAIRSRRFWDECSAAQRKILVERGGKNTNRNHNVGDGLGPSRIETYQASGYDKQVWWYYDLGHTAEAYTFVNGRLESYYSF